MADEKLVTNLKAAKTKPMFFAMVAQGANGKLIVDKAKINAKSITEAKSELGGGKAYTGRVRGEGDTFVFEMVEEAPGTLGELTKKTIKRDASLTVKVDYRVATELAGEGSEGESSEVSEGSTSSPTPSNPEAERYTNRLNALMPVMNKAESLHKGAATQAKKAIEEGNKAFLAKDYTEANAALSRAEMLIKNALNSTGSSSPGTTPPSPPPPPPPPGGDSGGGDVPEVELGKRLLTRLLKLEELVKKIEKVENEHATSARQGMKDARELAKTKHFREANDKLNVVEEELKSALKASPMPPPLPPGSEKSSSMPPPPPLGSEKSSSMPPPPPPGSEKSPSMSPPPPNLSQPSTQSTAKPKPTERLAPEKDKEKVRNYLNAYAPTLKKFENSVNTEVKKSAEKIQKQLSEIKVTDTMTAKDCLGVIRTLENDVPKSINEIWIALGKTTSTRKIHREKEFEDLRGDVPDDWKEADKELIVDDLFNSVQDALNQYGVKPAVKGISFAVFPKLMTGAKYVEAQVWEENKEALVRKFDYKKESDLSEAIAMAPAAVTIVGKKDPLRTVYVNKDDFEDENGKPNYAKVNAVVLHEGHHASSKGFVEVKIKDKIQPFFGEHHPSWIMDEAVTDYFTKKVWDQKFKGREDEYFMYTSYYKGGSDKMKNPKGDDWLGHAGKAIADLVGDGTLAKAFFAGDEEAIDVMFSKLESIKGIVEKVA